MSEAAQKLAKRLEKEGQKAQEFFGGLPAVIWEETVYTDGASWKVGEVLAHIVETESALPRLFKYIAEGGEGVPQDFDLNGYNEQAVDALAHLSPDRLLEMLNERRSDTVGFVRSLNDESLSREGNHPFLGQAPLNEMIRLFYLHVQLHIRDIRSLLDERMA